MIEEKVEERRRGGGRNMRRVREHHVEGGVMMGTVGMFIHLWLEPCVNDSWNSNEHSGEGESEGEQYWLCDRMCDRRGACSGRK